MPGVLVEQNNGGDLGFMGYFFHWKKKLRISDDGAGSTVFICHDDAGSAGFVGRKNNLKARLLTQA